jgi:DNA invertase Pin-like site-specific DNA recombinase
VLRAPAPRRRTGDHPAVAAVPISAALTELAAQLDERGIDLIVLKQGIDTTTPAGRFLFHVIAAMDEIEADLIRLRTKEG